MTKDNGQRAKELIRMDFCHFVSEAHFCKVVVRLTSRMSRGHVAAERKACLSGRRYVAT